MPTNPNLGRPVLNKYKVPMKQWRKWSNHARKVFNEMMRAMAPKMQHVFLHPEAPMQSREHWQTTRWNAAWIAASTADGVRIIPRSIPADRKRHGK